MDGVQLFYNRYIFLRVKTERAAYVSAYTANPSCVRWSQGLAQSIMWQKQARDTTHLQSHSPLVACQLDNVSLSRGREPEHLPTEHGKNSAWRIKPTTCSLVMTMLLNRSSFRVIAGQNSRWTPSADLVRRKSVLFKRADGKHPTAFPPSNWKGLKKCLSHK